MLNPQRTIDELKELRKLTGDENGAQRVAFTPTWLKARAFLKSKLAEIPNVTVKTDPAGNLWATLKGKSDKALLMGGHFDSVPNGGWLDGCLNVLAGLEVLRRIASEGTSEFTIKLVDWCDEEGARFGRSLFGSAAASGALVPDDVANLTDKDGVKLIDAVREVGIDLHRVLEAKHELINAVAYLELHIEQGPVLEALNLPMGIVLGTFGVERYQITFTGQAAHSGSTPMDKRRDALAGVSKLHLAIRDIAVKHGGVCTVGSVKTKPGIVTAVVGEAEMTLDQRHLDAKKLAMMFEEAKDISKVIARDEKIDVAWKKIWSIQPFPFHPKLIDLGDSAIQEVCGISHRLPSGPLHDAAEVCRGGCADGDVVRAIAPRHLAQQDRRHARGRSRAQRAGPLSPRDAHARATRERIALMRRAAISLGGIAILAAIALGIAGIELLQRSNLGVPPSTRPASSTPRDVVTVWGWNIAALSLDAHSKVFEASHPDTEVDVKVNGTALKSRFLLSMSTGRGGPDVSQLQEREVSQFTGSGKLADLSSWAAKYEKDFSPNFWASCVYDGHVYALPWDIAPCAVFYKRWIFEKYGIDPEKIETWDDYIAAGQQLVERSSGKTKLMLLTPNGLGPPFQMLMLQAGGGVFNARGEIILDSAENRVALGTLRKLLGSGVTQSIGVSAGELQVSYNDPGDSVASYPGAVWLMQDMKDSAKSTAGKWGVFRLPALVPGGIRTSNQGGSVLVIPAQSKQIAKAAAFAESALCTVDAQLDQFKNFGLFPGYLPALKDPRFDAADPFFADQHVARLFAQDFEKLTPLVRMRDWDEAEQLIGQTMYYWALNGEDNDAYLKRVSALLSERLGRKLAGQ